MASKEEAELKSHPIYRSVEEALRLLSVCQQTAENCDNDDGAAMKVAMADLMASFQNIQTVAETHPDGKTMVPLELLEENADWDAIQIKELERLIDSDDKVRHQKRHMSDLSQLLSAAIEPIKK